MTLVETRLNSKARQAPTRLAKVRAAWWRHPETPAALIAITAWIGLGVDHFSNHDGTTASMQFRLSAWTAMVLAMMVPGVLPMIRYVAFNSLWSRRHRSSGLFVATYVAAWVVLGIGGWATLAALKAVTGAPLDGRFALAAVGAVAVAWQMTSIKHRALRRCHLRKPLAARSTAADLSAMRYGFFHAWACMASCWVIMALMLVSHDFHLMVPLAAVTIVERYRTRPTGTPGAAAIAVAVLIAVV